MGTLNPRVERKMLITHLSVDVNQIFESAGKSTSCFMIPWLLSEYIYDLVCMPFVLMKSVSSGNSVSYPILGVDISIWSLLFYGTCKESWTSLLPSINGLLRSIYGRIFKQVHVVRSMEKPDCIIVLDNLSKKEVNLVLVPLDWILF